MQRELIVTSLPGETRMALLEDGEVVELGVEQRTEASVLHGIFRGRVQRVVPGTQAAFLDIGLPRSAFLQVDQVPEGALATLAGATDEAGTAEVPASGGRRLEDLLRTGKTALVQVVREPLGPKGYKVSCDLNLQGRFFDYRPFGSTGVIVARDILGPRERLRLRALAERRVTLDGQWLVRPIAEQRDEESLTGDIARIEADWAEIRREGSSGPPACLRAEIPMVFRTVRDVLSTGFGTIRVDSETLYGRMVNFVRQSLPGAEHKVRYYSKNYPIFEEYGVESAFDQATRRRVKLPSGGSIVIDQTEALVAVDVNTGKFTGDNREREETNTHTNLEAAVETARQLRLRGLGGIIVIDFIDMREAQNRTRIFGALTEELRRDPAFTRVSPPEPLAGLVIVTRKRERPAHETSLLASCPACRGSGKVPSLRAVCQEVLTRAQKKAGQFASGLVIRAAPELAAALLRSEVLPEVRRVIGGAVEVESVPALPEPQFQLRAAVAAARAPAAAASLPVAG